jgi:hypothetical protein
MRHQPLADSRQPRDGAVAAVWPSFEVALLNRQPLPLAPIETRQPAPAHVFTPTPAAPDVPAAVGRLIVAPYVALLGVFFALFARSPLALFAIVVCTCFVAIYFAIPRIFFAVEADPSLRPSLARFLDDGMVTLTGRTSGRDALVQMTIVPVLLAIGLLTMGIVGKIYIG